MYESNGQDVKIRGTASHIAEKYLQLARDAQSSGDTIASENYYQHAEHYFRLIAAAQEQLRQTQPYYQQQGDARGNASDDDYDDSEGDQPSMGGEPFAPQPQPFYPREQQHQPQQFQPQQPSRRRSNTISSVRSTFSPITMATSSACRRSSPAASRSLLRNTAKAATARTVKMARTGMDMTAARPTAFRCTAAAAGIAATARATTPWITRCLATADRRAARAKNKSAAQSTRRRTNKQRGLKPALSV